jgi:hypothetical protein
VMLSQSTPFAKFLEKGMVSSSQKYVGDSFFE